MNNFLTIDPLRIFEIKGHVSPLLTAVVSLSTGNNQSVIAAVTGSVIRVMGITGIGTPNTEAQINFKDGSGGTQIFGGILVPYSGTGTASTAGGHFDLPVIYSGYKDLTVSTGLFADVTLGSITGNVHYITYIP